MAGDRRYPFRTVPLGRLYEEQACSLARALEVVGERWTLLIVRDAFHGLTRYDEFQRSLGVATNVLSDRLRRLVDRGVLQKDGPRGRYTLTAKGRELLPVILTLTAWADRNEPGPNGPEVTIVHKACRHPVGGTVHCEHCGEPVEDGDVRAFPAEDAVDADGNPTDRTPPQLAAWGAG